MITPGRFVRGIFNALSADDPIDPFAVKRHSKASLTRICWTLQSRFLESKARHRHRLFFGGNIPDGVEYIRETGALLEDTAVTVSQLTLLKKGLEAVAGLSGQVVEVGSYRGVTTAELARSTSKTVHAIDPFVGYGGHEKDLEVFLQRTAEIATIEHIRMPSGTARNLFAEGSVSFAFIDAIHDVSNSWFDSVAWSSNLVSGGLLALHDVDDHPGVGFTVREFLKRKPSFSVWGYCRNLVILKKS